MQAELYEYVYDMSMFRTRAEVQNFLENTKDKVSDPMYEELDVDITPSELKWAITGLRNNKAAGPGRLIYEIFKYIDSLHPLILKLFNKIFKSGQFPI